MTILAVIGLSLLSLTIAPVSAQVATPVPVGCTAGSSGIGDPYYPLLGNSGYNVQHYTLDLDLDVAGGSIAAGRATIEAIALLDLCAFNLDFRGLEIDTITVDEQPAAFSRHGGELTVEPGAPLPAGSRFTTEIAYHGAPIGQDAPTVGGLIWDDLRRHLRAWRRRAETRPRGGRAVRLRMVEGARGDLHRR